MAEAFYQSLIEKVISLIEGEIGLLLGVYKEMKKLSNSLTTIQKVLEDAEDKQFQSKAIQNWLSKLNEIAFEIEDVLDECVTEVSKQKKQKCIGGYDFIKKNLHNHKIGRMIKEVTEKLDVIAADRNIFPLNEGVPNLSNIVDWRRETGSVVNEPDHIYSRDEDREKIVDMLLNQVSNCDRLSVLPIIGVGGLGKTTLAQLIYNDERVTRHFDTRLWVSVSDNFDPKILVEAMIESATGGAPNVKYLHALQCRLQQVLNNKRYLLVLDDVWNENPEDWVKLKSILACGSKGSSVVVTTRVQKVGDIMRTLPAYCLNKLSEEHCWLLFKLRAFGEEEQHQHPNLENIGRQIVKKCAGVPLAAKALGGLLRFRREENDWIRVKESEIWNLPEEEENSILPVLRLSYCHLPVVLKRCFAYCAVFPKNFEMDKQELILCWMAHGCISSTDNQEVEDVGDQVWNELVLRSFFQEDTSTERQTTFKMHDLFYDLALFISENKIPRAEMNTHVSDSKIREVHWRHEYYDFQSYSSSITQVVSTLSTIMNYKHVRILRLHWANMKYLPSEIGKLKHLRIFDASYSSIHSLPRAFCCLWNLQTLILTDCYSLKSLPKHLRRMTNLRHIFLDNCDSLSHMPSRISELTSLKTLSLFIVGEKIGNQLDELEYLNLGGRLEIRHLERVGNHMNPEKANLAGKPNLRCLVLSWEDERTSSELTNMMDDEKVLEALEPHVNLETLEIRGFRGRQFPSWITKMENLTEIVIQHCPNCWCLPPFGGLPRLGSLCLRNVDALEYINGEHENGVFPSLQLLELSSLQNLKGLLKNEVGEMMFPNLQKLDISNCPLLILPPALTQKTHSSCC